MAATMSIAAHAKRLRDLLAARPYVASATASALESGACHLGLAAIVLHDEDAGTSPSLLYLAAAAADTDAVQCLLRERAMPLAHENLHTLFASVLPHDARVVDVASMLHSSAASVSAITLLCIEKGWAAHLNDVITHDPWAMHALQRMPQHVAARVAAREEAHTLALRVQRGEDGVVVAAVEQLTTAMTAARVMPFLRADAMALARARSVVHATVQAYASAGILTAVLRQPRAPSVMDAAATRDVDLVLQVNRSGAVLQQYHDVYSRLLCGDLPCMDVDGAPVQGDRLAEYLQALHGDGLVMPSRTNLSFAARILAQAGNVPCLRLMIDGMDGSARLPASNGCTLLHHAARRAQAAACQYLIDEGFSIHLKSLDGHTPLCMALITEGCGAVAHATLSAVCDTVATLTAHMIDVREVLRHFATVSLPRAREQALAAELKPFSRLGHARLVLSIIAAVRVYPVIERRMRRTLGLCAPASSLFRTLSLDAHSVHGVYIPDQLRAGGRCSCGTRAGSACGCMDVPAAASSS